MGVASSRRPLRALVVEDSDDDTALLVRTLRTGGFDPVWARVDTAAALTAALARRAWDIVLVDYSMPSFSGPQAIALLRESGLDLPVIVVSGAIGEDTAVAMMKAGARDCVMKSNLRRLLPAIERELLEAAVRRAGKHSEVRYRELFENTNDIVYTLDLNGNFTSINRPGETVSGFSRDEVLAMNVAQLLDPESHRMICQMINLAAAGKAAGAVSGIEVEAVSRAGQRIALEVSVWLLYRDGVPVEVQGIARDRTGRKRLEGEPADVIRSVPSALAHRRPQRTVRMWPDRTVDVARLRETMGASEAVSRIGAGVAQVACSDLTVLILGETGSGKELVARAIHQSSPRAAGPFVAVDCGAIPEALFESELFGHEKGAFTGADRSKPGRFESAQGGTLFLDEIANMPLGSQAKLLRALHERSIDRVGGTQPIRIDARVLVAANEDIEAATLRGSFRKDLYFRLNEFIIRVPALRERKPDIVYLAKRFIDHTNQELGKTVTGLSDGAIQRLLAFHWPGNVRQLRSVIRRAVLLADSVIEGEHLGLPADPEPCTAEGQGGHCVSADVPLRQLVRRATATVERAALLQALQRTGGNKARAARLLQIDYKTLYSKLREYGLQSQLGATGGCGAEDS